MMINNFTKSFIRSFHFLHFLNDWFDFGYLFADVVVYYALAYAALSIGIICRAGDAGAFHPCFR